VRRLAAQLFDQLAPIHELPPGQRVPLELGALLHDVGLAVNPQSHHKHGEYLVRNADIPGLSGHQQVQVACLVRYHGKATPEPHHRLYRSLAPAERKRVRQLAALLRIAVALDANRAQKVRRVDSRIHHKTVWLRITATSDARIDFREIRDKAKFFEREFGVRVRLGRARRAPNGANGRTTRITDSIARIRRSAAAVPRRSAA